MGLSNYGFVGAETGMAVPDVPEGSGVRDLTDTLRIPGSASGALLAK